ncbi:D-alanyl-D-alanine carboxypeptidase [Streptomyces sp. NPDC006296]|uniref:D-alanyl-D-alanine carboxypeptidase family protein n=1 Tax=Streptomyces sp. NPDC006296 TaxID=3156746 RepID=UPI0033B5329D
MAGESPGRSDQRKSSGTAEERDPRLAVFREADAEAAGNTTAGKSADGNTADRRANETADAGKDSETAVFRLPRSAKADAPSGASASPKGAESPGGASTPSKGREGTTEADDAPEEAPAAPGASEETPAASGASASAGEPAPGVDAESESEAEAAAVSGAGTAGADAGSAAGPAPGEAAAAASGARPEAGSKSGAAGSGTGAGSGPEAGAGATPTDARLQAAVAAWVATGPDGETSDRSAGSEGADQPSRPEGEASDEAGSTAASGEAESAADSVTAPASAGAPRVPKTREEASPAEEPKPESDPAKAPKPEPVKEAKPDPEPVKEPEPEEKPEPASDGRGIDHPTAVFKAPQAKQLDQPTTALKLPPTEEPKTGPAGKPDRKPKEPAGERAGKQDTGKQSPKQETERKPSWAAKVAGTTEAPEAPEERTSTFVPLRSDDGRPAAVVGPTVTPDVAAGPGTPGAPGAGLTEAERTRQQPMPPRPPLDLLAELTNTPPPPETPVRTAVRRVKIWTPLVLLLLVVFAIAQAVRPLPDPTLTLSADPTYTFGGGKLDMPWPEEGQGAVEVEGVGTVGTYGKEKSAPIASVAKIMTAYVILQGHPITGKEDGGTIEVDAKAGEEANRPDESTAPIKAGQKYTERQMLQLLMIPSGNNVARLLARWDATTEKAFVGKMNAAAKDLGMTNSVYTDPSGLESTTRSTPADQLKLAKAVMQNDIFREIVNMPQAEIPGIGKMIYNNNNILLEPGVSGIKTGSSTPAGGNLVWTAETIIDGKSRRIIGAVMGADVDGTLDAKLQRALQSSLALIQAAQEGVDSATVVKKGQVVGYVDNGFGGRTPVVATKDLKAVGWGGLEVDLKLSDGGKTPAHAAKAGTVVGEVTVGTGTGKVSAPVALQSETTEPGFGDKLTRIT